MTGFRVCVRTQLTNAVPQGRLRIGLVQISFSRPCPSTSNHAKVRHRPLICHPERSRGTCCAPFPLTTPYSSVHPSPPMPRWPTLALVEMDGPKHFHSTNPISLVHVLFHAFSKLRRPEGHLRANLDSFG